MKRIFLLYITLLIITFLLTTAQGYAEDIVLTDNQVMLIENTTYTQDGNIFIRDNARLTISNSTLIFNQRYHGEFNIVVEGNGTFEVIHSTIETGINLDESVTAFLFNEANVLVEYSDLLPGKFYFCFGGLHGEVYKGKAFISNSKFLVLSITCAPDDAGPEITVSNSWMNGLGFRFDKNYQGDFQDLRQGFQSYWSYNQGNYDITLIDTTFTHLDLFCDGPAQITVRNSEISGIGCTGDYSPTTLRIIDSTFDCFSLHGFSQKIVQLSNLKKGFHNYWSLRDHATGDYIPNVILENSVSIRGWLVTSYRATLSIDNSELVRFNSHGCGLYSPTDIATITNSTIQELMLYYSYATLIFDNTNIHTINVYLPSDAIIKGNITFDEDAFIRNWFNSIVTRNYPIFLRDQNENIISGADINLYSKDGELVWSGLTDEDGKANFDIVFNDNNYLDTWKLEVNYNGRKFYKYIALLTSTPITIPKYTIAISATAGGTTDPAPDTYTYDEGTEVYITAMPDTGYRFSGWTGDVPQGHENDNPLRVVMDSSKTLTANFTLITYTLTTEVDPLGGGSVVKNPDNEEYSHGESVELTANASEGYRFIGWTGDVPSGHENDNPITITIDADKSITANFIRQYTLTLSVGEGGTIDPAPDTYTHDEGTEIIITAIPGTSYRFMNWSGDVSSTDNPITINMDADKSITANFIRQNTLTIAAGTGGTTNPSPGEYMHDSGTQVSITAIPNSGYQFSRWSGTASGTSNPITITMDSDKSITANFKAITIDDKKEPGKKGGCFIATAAYGLPLHPHLDILRDFRDKYLMPSKIGCVLVYFYYKYSPFVADFITRHKILKVAVQVGLLPMIAFSYSMIHFGTIITAVMLVFIFVLPIFLISFFWRKMSRLESKDP